MAVAMIVWSSEPRNAATDSLRPLSDLHDAARDAYTHARNTSCIWRVVNGFASPASPSGAAAGPGFSTTSITVRPVLSPGPTVVRVVEGVRAASMTLGSLKGSSTEVRAEDRETSSVAAILKSSVD